MILRIPTEYFLVFSTSSPLYALLGRLSDALAGGVVDGVALALAGGVGDGDGGGRGRVGGDDRSRRRGRGW